MYCIAIDVGTTNVTIILTRKNRIIDKIYAQNPQTKFGADILTRYTATLKNSKTKQEMHQLIVETIAKSIDKLCKNNKIDESQLKKISIVGNTMMYCFLLDLNPAPFISRKKVMKNIKSNYNKIDLDLPKNAELIIPPPIVSYIGSDALALILFTEIHNSKDIKLIVDFGTNTEIILGNKEKILVTSVAGGAAFEDDSISISSAATEGAIYSATWKNEKFEYSFFGKRASSVCGSGIIDIVTELRKNEIIDKTGKFIKQEKGFAVTKEITITQKDIRAIQLAKSATISAINLLIKERRIGKDNIKSMYMTGIFGKHLNIRNAKYLGLLPAIPHKRIMILEDVAAKGAARLLTRRYNIRELYSKVKFVDLPTKKEFKSQFIRNMSLCHQE